MNKISLLSIIALFLFQACAQEPKKNEEVKIEIPKTEIIYTLNDYLKEDKALGILFGSGLIVRELVKKNFFLAILISTHTFKQ